MKVKYYGVSASDVKAGEHRLMDTASFAQTIAHKLYSSNPGNNFVMTIAGYGTGKSHLAVCLGALFSGTGELAESIASNISSADEEIGTYIRQNNVKKNLVIVLNGMNNFNLDSEILRCARLSLAQNLMMLLVILLIGLLLYIKASLKNMLLKSA